MLASLALTALLMGAAGGAHCVAMCGAACGTMVGTPRAMLQFQFGRLLGYALAGAVAGAGVQSFAWLTQHTAALQPVWTLFHLAVLGWGLMLLAQARQPAWLEAAGRNVWSHMRPIAQARGGLVATGALWTFMPCGLLYSALLVASLAGGALEGALCMTLFAVGSGVWLGIAPAALRKLQTRANRLRDGSGTRIAGVLLALTAAWALWMDLSERIAQWCAV